MTFGALLAAICAVALNCDGAVRTWTGEGANPVWSNRTNWTGLAIPADGDSIVFAGARNGDRAVTNNLQGLKLGSLSFSTGIDQLILRGEPLVISNELVHATPGVNRAELDLLLADDARVTSTNGGTLRLGGEVMISGRTVLAVHSDMVLGRRVSGAGDLVKNGAGTLTFGGSVTNTFTGSFIARDGVTRLERTPGAFSAGAIRVDGATLVVAGSDQWPPSTILTVENGALVRFDETSQTNTVRDLELHDATVDGRNFTLRIRRSIEASSSTNGAPARIAALNLGATIEPVGEVGVNVTAGELDATLGIAGAADVTLVKRGAGRLRIGKTVSPDETARFGGLFQVNAGVLQIDGETDAGVNVGAGGELTGTGEVHAVSVIAGGTFRSSPPVTGATAFSVGGSLALADGARFVASFRKLNSQQFLPFQVLVDGRLIVNNATLEIDSEGSAAVADNTRLTVIRPALTNAPGEFEGVASGAPLVIGNRVFSASYTNGGFSVVAAPGANQPPEIEPPANRTVDEGSTVDFLIGYSDPNSSDAVALALVSAPAGATLEGGRFVWTTREADGPGRFPVTVRASDSGTPSLTAETTFEIVVNEVNRNPVFAVIQDRRISTGQRLEIPLTATDDDRPPQTLLFSHVSGPGVIVSNLLYRWTVPATAENTTNLVTLRVFDGFTNATITFTVIVPTNAPPEPNRPPVFEPVADQTVRVGDTLEVVLAGSDPDAPPQMTLFYLDRPPAGMTLEGNIIRWTPALANTNGVTIRAILQDNGDPIEQVERTFRVFVLPAGALASLSITRQADGSLRIEWPLADADQNLQHATALSGAPWSPASESRTTNGSTLRVTVQPAASTRFFRLFRPASQTGD
jgi:autotransporter-associated beta strand protein